MIWIAIGLAFVWGGIWAAFLTWHRYGVWLAAKRTWITVVVGVGVDLLILLLILSPEMWWSVFWVITASSILIIVRSLTQELNEEEEILNVYANPSSQQDDLVSRGPDHDIWKDAL